jgi:hypothetical protein
MKSSLLATGATFSLLALSAVADDIPDNYAVSIFKSKSTYPEVDGLDVQAVDGEFRLGGKPSTLCAPDDTDDCSSDITALYNYTSLVGF